MNRGNSGDTIRSSGAGGGRDAAVRPFTRSPFRSEIGAPSFDPRYMGSGFGNLHIADAAGRHPGRDSGARATAGGGALAEVAAIPSSQLWLGTCASSGRGTRLTTSYNPWYGV